jgi:intein/homing endonuclease
MSVKTLREYINLNIDKEVINIFNTRTSWIFVNLVFSNGNHLRCTPGHPIYLSDGTTKQASEIKEGDKVVQYRYSGLDLRCTKGKKYEEI